MARGWRLNPPPNWPALPADWRPTDGWRPDPQWGPAPVGWTLWRRERRAAWLYRHKTMLFLGAGTLVIAASALAGPVATELITAEGPPLSGTPVSEPERPAGQVPAPVSSEDVRSEPQLEQPVRRPQQSAPASRSRPRASDDPTSAAVPTPSTLPLLPVPAEPVPQLRALPVPSGSCDPDEQGSPQWPGRDRHDRDSRDRQAEVVLVVAAHGDRDGRAHDEQHPDRRPCPAPTTSGDAPPG